MLVRERARCFVDPPARAGPEASTRKQGRDRRGVVGVQRRPAASPEALGEGPRCQGPEVQRSPGDVTEVPRRAGCLDGVHVAAPPGVLRRGVEGADDGAQQPREHTARSRGPERRTGGGGPPDDVHEGAPAHRSPRRAHVRGRRVEQGPEAPSGEGLRGPVEGEAPGGAVCIQHQHVPRARGPCGAGRALGLGGARTVGALPSERGPAQHHPRTLRGRLREEFHEVPREGVEG